MREKRKRDQITSTFSLTKKQWGEVVFYAFTGLLIAIWIMSMALAAQPNILEGNSITRIVSKGAEFTLDSPSQVTVESSCYDFKIGKKDNPNEVISPQEVVVEKGVPIKCQYQRYYTLESTPIDKGVWVFQEGKDAELTFNSTEVPIRANFGSDFVITLAVAVLGLLLGLVIWFLGLLMIDSIFK